jgi:hypothetical protein
MSDDYIGELIAVFSKLHDCDATYVETVSVIEDSKARRFGKVMLNALTFTAIRKQHAVTDGDM